MIFKNWLQKLNGDGPDAKTEAQSVGEWLWIVTCKLANPARRRITKEIKNHYDEAVDAHMLDGMTKDVAKTTALKELGDPQKASRKFRDSHLTEKELVLLKRKHGAATESVFDLEWVLQDLVVLGIAVSFLFYFRFGSRSTTLTIWGIALYLRFRFLPRLAWRLTPQRENFYRTFARAMVTTEAVMFFGGIIRLDFFICLIICPQFWSWLRICDILRQSRSNGDQYEIPQKHLPSS